MQEKTAEFEQNNLKEHYSFGKVARQADGAVLYRQGKAVLLATVVMEEKPVEEPFLPLTVQYIEKAYAAAKIPGGFIKRETKPGDFEILTSRIVDRSLRPLFPEGFAHPVQITILVLSADEKVDLQVAALHAANAAVLLSPLPIERSIAAVRLGRDAQGNLLVNPSLEALEEGSLDLLLVGSGSELTMIEMAARATEVIDDLEMEELPPEALMGPMPLILPHQESNEVDEEEFVGWLRMAAERIETASRAYAESFLPLKRRRDPETFTRLRAPEELVEFLRGRLAKRIDAALAGLSKSERGAALGDLRRIAAAESEEYGMHPEPAQLQTALETLVGEAVRRQILDERRRADGRTLEEVRPIEIENNLLPSVHGSCLFTRGETQALVTATLGEAKEGQMYELLTDHAPRTERFMVHYNFPPFSVGEARPIGAPGRRELGHGNLAKRALEPVVDVRLDKTIRLVSEILESNGSSSMATVCGGALALCAAEVEIKALVAGVAMGLVKEEERSAILTDIMGLEDHYGDMDFKVAGTRKGITALQMDIRSGGLDFSLLEKALMQAKEARLHILEIMEGARETIEPSGALPISEHFHIDPSAIVHVIGKAGSTIREIIQRFGVTIDLDREKGKVRVTGKDRDKVLAAREHISGIAANAKTVEIPTYEKGKRYSGTVKRVVDYGLFVEMPGGIDALLHVSKLGGEGGEDLRERFHPGEKIDVVVLDQKGRKVELATPEYYEASQG